MTTIPSTPRIAVIGAGVAGITTAYKLLDRGFEVCLFDRQPMAAMDTSFANGGQLSASNAQVWNSWSTVLNGLKWMMRRDAPLLVNPLPGWHKISWFAEFLMAIARYRENTIETVRMAIAAREHLTRMAEEAGIDFDRVDRGILHVYSNERDFEAAKRLSELLRAAGLDQRAVTPEEIRTIEPALRCDCYGGLYTPSDFTGDIHKFTVGLAAACRRRGARLCFECEVEGLAVDRQAVTVRWRGADGYSQPERFDAVVIAAGVGSRRLAAMLGARVNVYPVKGYSITVNLNDAESRAAAPWTSLLDEEAKIVSSRLGEARLRIAGTAEFSGENRDIRHDRIQPLIAWCRRHFPGVPVQDMVPWAGLRPMMPDMMPRVGATKRDRVFLNTGHGHLGWTLSALTADMVADSVAERFSGSVQPVAVPALLGTAASR